LRTQIAGKLRVHVVIEIDAGREPGHRHYFALSSGRVSQVWTGVPSGTATD
jgi:hypothetical protein